MCGVNTTCNWFDMVSGFVCISPIAPIDGKSTEFYIDHTPTESHGQLVCAMSKTPYGATLPPDFPLVRDIINRIVPQEVTAREEHIDNHSLVCVSSSCDAREMVFTLIRHCTALGAPRGYRSDSHGNLPAPTGSGDYLMRAIMRVCNARDGSRYIHNLVFPNAGCKVSITTDVSSDSTLPSSAWLRLLNGFGISDTDACESKSITSKSWERFCVRNAHTGMSVAITPRGKIVDTHTDTDNSLDISFTRGGEQQCIGVQACILENVLTELTQTHVGILQRFDNSRCNTEHKISLNDGAYELVFSTIHPSRVKCSLLYKTAGDRIIASSDVNFSNNMVYTNVSAAGIDNVFGVQRLALRAACRLQTNLTPHIIAQRIGSVNDSHVDRLLQLISATDIATDIGYVFKSHDTSTKKIRPDNRSMKQLRLKLINLTMKNQRQNTDNVIALQNNQFGRSPVFVEKRATSSSGAERPRWQDGHTTAAMSDNLMRQKMMSARGVATLKLYTDSKYGVDYLNTCVIFSNVKVPKMIYKESKCISGSFRSAKQLNWVTPPPAGAMHGRDLKTQTPYQFMYSFDRSSKQLKVFNRHNDTEKKERTVAVFTNAGDTLQDRAQTFVPQGVPKGSLVGELINCCEKSFSVYTRALAHLVLLDSMYRLGLICTKTSWGVYKQNWMNTYRACFLSTLAERGVPTGVKADQQYIDYCMFNQCLKQHVNGTRMPCDVFSLLVQQGIPFQYV
jgi:hypothetical protein